VTPGLVAAGIINNGCKVEVIERRAISVVIRLLLFQRLKIGRPCILGRRRGVLRGKRLASSRPGICFALGSRTLPLVGRPKGVVAWAWQILVRSGLRIPKEVLVCVPYIAKAVKVDVGKVVRHLCNRHLRIFPSISSR